MNDRRLLAHLVVLMLAAFLSGYVVAAPGTRWVLVVALGIITGSISSNIYYDNRRV